MGAEEYELLVSTLNKLPILKENLTSKREEYELARRMVYSQKAEIDEVKKELETKDEEIGKIDSKIKKNNQILEELDQVLADLEDNIKIEEEKFKPYSQRLDEANERLNRKKDSIWNNETFRGIVILVPMMVLIINWDLNTTAPESWFFAYCIGFPLVIGLAGGLAAGLEPTWFRATRKRHKVKSVWKKARGTLAGFEILRSRNNNTKTKLVLEEYKLKNEKVRLKGLEKKLKEMNKKLDGLENSASACSEAVESLVKEIEDEQNAIAPLIPYSNLLLDSSEE